MSDLPWAERPAGRSVRYTRALLRYHGREVIFRIAAPAATLLAWSVLNKVVALHVAAQLPVGVALGAWLAVAVHRAALAPERVQGARLDGATLRYAAGLMLLGLIGFIVMMPIGAAILMGAQAMHPEGVPLSPPLALLATSLGWLLSAVVGSRLLGASLLLLPMLALDEPLNYGRAKRLARPWYTDIAILLFSVPFALSAFALLLSMLRAVPLLPAALSAVLDVTVIVVAVLALSYLFKALNELDASASAAEAAVARAIADAQDSARESESPKDRPNS